MKKKRRAQVVVAVGRGWAGRGGSLQLCCVPPTDLSTPVVFIALAVSSASLLWQCFWSGMGSPLHV